MKRLSKVLNNRFCRTTYRNGQNPFLKLTIVLQCIAFLILPGCKGEYQQPDSGKSTEDSQKVSQPQDSHGHSHSGHGQSRNTGKDMAIIEADESRGIILAAKAIETCNIRFSTPGAYGLEELPATSHVRTGQAILVYVRISNRIFPVLISGTIDGIPGLRSKGEVPFAEVEVVILNADLTHLGYLEAFGASGSGHGH